MRVTSATAKSVLMSAALLHTREDSTSDYDVFPMQTSPLTESSTSFLTHLEHCYELTLAEQLGVEDSEPEAAETILERGADGKVSIGDTLECEALTCLASRLGGILARAGCGAYATLWGVELGQPSPERASLLSCFLRARQWDVVATEAFMLEALTWRREQRIGREHRADEESARAEEAVLGFPEDVIRTRHRRDHSGRPHTFVRLAMGQLSLESLRAADEVSRLARP